MRYVLALLTVVAILAVPVVPASAGLLCHPPKLEKMLKPPHCKKDKKKPGESYTGKQEECCQCPPRHGR
jgi:hypothetical protein